MRKFPIFVVVSVLGLSSTAIASPEETSAVLASWSKAYEARDHRAMAGLHAPLARVRGMDEFHYIGHEAISELYYFEADKAKAQSVTFISQDCYVYDDGNVEDNRTALCSGIVELKQTLTSGETRLRPARFSMALVVEDNRWMIYDHNTTWLPVVVAGCGTSVPPDKAAIASGPASSAVSTLCSDTLKTGALGRLPRVIPAGAETVAPTK